MADYAPVAINIGTGPAGSDGDTTRAAFQKAVNDLAQIWAAFTIDTTSNDIGIGRSPETNRTLTVADSQEVIADGSNANSIITSYGGVGAFVVRAANGTYASPSAILNGENICRIDARGYDDAGFDDGGATIAIKASENWTASAHGSRMVLRTTPNGGVSNVDRVIIDQDGGMYTTNATGGSQGIDTINAKGVYDDGALLTDYVFEYHVDGEAIDDHDRAQAFKIQTLDLDYTAAFWRNNKHLPNMPSRDEWKEQKLSVGELAQRLWEVCEVQAIHIQELNQRNKGLAERITALEVSQ